MRRLSSITVVCVCLAGGFLTGICWQAVPSAQADVRQGPQREAFKSGGERSAEVLTEIAATLKRIETRVDRIEQLISTRNAP